MNFLDELQEMTSEAETPTSWIYWAGLTSISGVVRNKVYIKKKGFYKLYPNIFCLLVGRSGLGKGFPVYIVRTLIEKVGNTRSISGRNSIESILQSLGKATTSPNGGPPETDATAVISSGEFSNLIIDNPQAFTILTDLYDGHYNPVWKNTLKTAGIDTLKNICITLFGGINETHYADKISGLEITGGFIGRTMVIQETNRSKIDPLLDEAEIEFDPDKLVPYLKKLSTLSGAFKLSSNARMVFDPWFKEIREKESIDFTGTIARMPDHVLKIAMLLSLSERDDLIIEESHIEQGINLCTQSVMDVKKIHAGMGVSELSAKIKIFMRELIHAEDHVMEHSIMLRRNYGNFDTFDLGKIVETLLGGNLIKVYKNSGKTFYKLSEKSIIEYFGGGN